MMAVWVSFVRVVRVTFEGVMFLRVVVIVRVVRVMYVKV